MGTYTVIKKEDGRPVAIITALTEESAEAQIMEGFFLIPGEFSGKLRWNGSKMVVADREFSQLQFWLQHRILNAGQVGHEDELAAVAAAKTRGDLTDLLATYWPTEGEDP